MILNSFQDYNEKNFGIIKLKIKYPSATEEEIYEKLYQGKERKKGRK